MGLDRDGYVVGLLEQLSARRGEVALPGIGLALIALTSPRLTIEVRRGGRLCTQAFSWGVANGPVRSEPTDCLTGTRVSFTLPNDAPAIARQKVLSQIEVWRAAHPNLRVEVDVGEQRAS